ncbi:MAG: ABC transporter permease [Pedosphaera sp.]|jgi:ABC-type transport system involved in multi-copper enzyme maturation permease subunit|nr:ABC transporter permease [Pedosphaera sp.]
MDTVSKTSTLAACLQVFRLSLRRQFFTRQTIVMLVLLGLAVLITYLWSLPKQWHPDPRTSAELARQIVLPLYMGFLLPVICLGYASAAIADERTGETLVYLLTTNIPRPLVYLSKYAAALLLTLGMTLGGLAVLCLMSGKIGLEALGVFWTVTACATTAYVGLFLLFSAWVRRATFLALAYALMIETLTGNIPGVVKRITVSFYAKSWLYESGETLDLAPSGVALGLFDPVSAATAQSVLALASVGFLALGIWVFSRKEYD